MSLLDTTKKMGQFGLGVAEGAAKETGQFMMGLAGGMASETKQIMKEQVMRIGADLKRRFSAENITGTVLGGGPMAHKLAKRMFGKKDSKDADLGTGKLSKNSQLLQSSESQTLYLQSIDETLRDIKADFDIMFDRKNVDQFKAEHGGKMRASDWLKQKAQQKEGTKTGGVLDFLGNALSGAGGMITKLMGGALKFGAGALGGLSAGMDAKDAAGKADKWGVNKGVAGVAGFLGGTGEGFGNAAKKAMEMGAMGTAIAGPLGGIVGAILGAIAGYFGGEKIAKFIDSAFEKAKETLTDLFETIADYIKAGIQKLSDINEDITNWIDDVTTGLTSTVKGIFSNILATVQEKFGGLLSALGEIPGLGKLKEMGSSLTASGLQKRDDAEKERTDREANIAARDKESNKQRTAREDTWNLKYGATPAAPAAPAAPAKAASSTPTPVKATGAAINKDMGVGEITGDAIKAAAEFASKMADTQGPGGDIVVPPEALAGIVAQESGGKSNVKAGDGGKSVGITQMKQVALDDVNQTFGTNFSQQQIMKDTNAALQAAALYLKLNMMRRMRAGDTDINSAIAKYNGSGDAAQKYAAQVAAKIDAYKVAQAPSASPTVAPVPKTTGQATAAISKENAALASAPQQAASAQPVVISQPTSVQHSSTLQMPMPSSRNLEESFSRISSLNWIVGA